MADKLAANFGSSLTLGTQDNAIAHLEQRQLSILKRIEQLERRLLQPSAAAVATASPEQLLEQRQHELLRRIEEVEARLQGVSISQEKAAASTPQPSLSVASPVQLKLAAELQERGVPARFVRAPPDYYDRPLEFRQQIVGAASIDHLCKSIVMENTRVEAEEPGVAKYWLVVVQYSARLHSDRLRNFVHAAHGGKLAKSRINMRLCPEDVSDRLTGFQHNGVSPIGIATRLPIIMSHRIAALQPDEFWLGAGEVDLKVGMAAADFVRAYEPNVVECTYES